MTTGPDLRAAVCALLVAPLLAACGDAAPPRAADATALERAVARLDAPFGGYLEFVDRAALADAPPSWEPLASGSAGMRAEDLSDVLGVDLAAADALLVAGQAPQQLTLLLGGQDEARIRDRAGAAGWSDDGVLRRELDLREPLTLYAGTLRPLGADVAFGGPAAAVDVVDGPGAGAGDPAVDAMTACLGDVALALLAGEEHAPSEAVGLRRPGADGSATSVVCTTAATAEAVTGAVTTGASARTGQPWSQLLHGPQVEELPGGVVRLVARNAPGVAPGAIVSALVTRDLPGVPA